MKLGPQNLIRRRRVNKILYIGVFLVLGAIVSISVAAASSSSPQTGTNASGQNTQASPIIVYPTVVNITGLQTTWIGGRPFLVVTMVATNNIGIVPAWRNEKVEFQSVNFTISYNSTSVAGNQNGILIQPTTPTPMTFSADELKTFSVTIGPFPSTITGTLVVKVDGWYSWFFVVHNVGNNPGEISTNNGGGRFVEFVGVVTF